MLLIYAHKTTQRIAYTFKHVCTRILGINIKFTSKIEEFIAYSGPKISYGKKPLGNELFFQSTELLLQQGFDSIDINVKGWNDTKCFFSVSKISALPFDIFSASFYLLSRYEEYLPQVKDEKGRFLATESLAFKSGFLTSPVVDVWAYQFKKALLDSYPDLPFPKKEINYHQIIKVSQPNKYNQKGALRSIFGFTKNVFRFNYRETINRATVLLGIKKDPFDTFEWIIDSTKNSKISLSVLFLLGESEEFLNGFNSSRSKFKLLVKNISDYKNVGLLFSKESLTNFEVLKNEKDQMESLINKHLKCTINNDFSVKLPDDYRNLIELEIEKDFTMVYENTPGFRASTCTPFLFYDLDYEIVTPLLIQPIAYATPSLLGESETKKNEITADLIQAVKNVNGTLSFIFSNKDFSDTKRNTFWRNLLIQLS